MVMCVWAWKTNILVKLVTLKFPPLLGPISARILQEKMWGRCVTRIEMFFMAIAFFGTLVQRVVGK